MLSIFDKKVRRILAGIFQGRFPGLYSTLDDPQEVPVQVAAYRLATDKYIHPGSSVLDVGFGLGYGMVKMAERAEQIIGIEIDRRAVSRAEKLVEDVPQIVAVKHFDGRLIPCEDKSFDVVTCVDVLELSPPTNRQLFVT